MPSSGPFLSRPSDPRRFAVETRRHARTVTAPAPGLRQSGVAQSGEASRLFWVLTTGCRSRTAPLATLLRDAAARRASGSCLARRRSCGKYGITLAELFAPWEIECGTSACGRLRPGWRRNNLGPHRTSPAFAAADPMLPVRDAIGKRRRWQPELSGSPQGETAGSGFVHPTENRAWRPLAWPGEPEPPSRQRAGRAPPTCHIRQGITARSARWRGGPDSCSSRDHGNSAA